MMTRVHRVTGAEDPVLVEAAALLRAGKLVAFPTETVYGLGADGLNSEAVARIYAAKGRPASNPLILHVAGVEAARELVCEWPESADRLAAAFWPGPLTLVLEADPCVPASVRGGGTSVALRCPAHPVALALLRQVGRPLAAPSANRSSQLSPTLAEHVVASLGDAVGLVLDAGPTAAGLESTILDLRSRPFRILRPGPLGPGELEACIGAVVLWQGAVPAGAIQAAPGMASRHYAPQAKLELVAPGAGVAVGPLRTAYVSLGPLPPLPAGITGFSLSPDPVAAGARLFALLHELDGAGFRRICFELPPPEEAWLAVRDRLQRAAAQA
jgi:L-threonylcarbamoyladenylate synthase